MFFFEDEDRNTKNFKIIDLQYNRRQWRVTSGAWLELDEETGEVNLVVDGESDLENYEINEILHEMILVACKLNRRGFAFITSRPEPRGCNEPKGPAGEVVFLQCSSIV